MGGEERGGRGRREEYTKEQRTERGGKEGEREEGGHERKCEERDREMKERLERVQGESKGGGREG